MLDAARSAASLRVLGPLSNPCTVTQGGYPATDGFGLN
jgi:hypothetical protein